MSEGGRRADTRKDRAERCVHGDKWAAAGQLTPGGDASLASGAKHAGLLSQTSAPDCKQHHAKDRECSIEPCVRNGESLSVHLPSLASMEGTKPFREPPDHAGGECLLPARQLPARRPDRSAPRRRPRFGERVGEFQCAERHSELAAHHCVAVAKLADDAAVDVEPASQ